MVNFPNRLTRICNTVIEYPFLFIEVFWLGIIPHFVCIPRKIPGCSSDFWVLVAVRIIGIAGELKEQQFFWTTFKLL